MPKHNSRGPRKNRNHNCNKKQKDYSPFVNNVNCYEPPPTEIPPAEPPPTEPPTTQPGISS